MKSIPDTSTDRRTLLPPLSDADPDGSPSAADVPDRRDGAVYVMDDSVRLAVDVALATNRPLLLKGDPGSGKSSLAAFVARNLGWRYYEHVVTSRTRATDLLWTFDGVRKLADATARTAGADPLRDLDYVEPGVLWWAFNRESAIRRGARADEPHVSAVEPGHTSNATRSPEHAVVLVDEIDKADPDVPNGLLVPLGSREFRVAESRTDVRLSLPDAGRTRHLVVITTNNERELPPAFLRRCIVHELRPPNGTELVEIARRHLAQAAVPVSADIEALLGALAAKVEELRTQAARLAVRAPSTAEYLDAVHACRALHISVSDEVWPRVQRLVLTKEPGERGAPGGRL